MVHCGSGKEGKGGNTGYKECTDWQVGGGKDRRIGDGEQESGEQAGGEQENRDQEQVEESRAKNGHLHVEASTDASLHDGSEDWGQGSRSGNEGYNQEFSQVWREECCKEDPNLWSGGWMRFRNLPIGSR